MSSFVTVALAVVVTIGDVQDKYTIGNALGFEFHEPTHDYRVVRIMYSEDDEGNLLGK